MSNNIDDMAKMFGKYGVATQEQTLIAGAQQFQQLVVNRKAAAEICRHLNKWLADPKDKGDAYQIKFPPLPK